MNDTITKLKPVVRYREFPFGAATDPSMREFMADRPWQGQSCILEYLRSGVILGYPMGGSLTDCFDFPNRANPRIGDRIVGGATPLTDGTWFWYAGLIHFIEKYNIPVNQQFLAHAEKQDWTIDPVQIGPGPFDYSYFS